MSGAGAPVTVTTLLAKLRKAGWSVAVHNDYRLDGEPATFWLFTHPDGRWVKGEGSTDVLALLDVAEEVVSLKTTISFPKPGDPVWIQTSDGWKQEVVAERPPEQYGHSFRVVGGARELFWVDRRSVWLEFDPCDPGEDETGIEYLTDEEINELAEHMGTPQELIRAAERKLDDKRTKGR